MVAYLGELGTKVEQEPIEFGWYGATMRAHPTATELPLVDFQEKALREEIDDNDPKAAVMLKDLLRCYVHPDDFGDFWAISQRNGVGLEGQMAVVMAVIEQLAERSPTKPSSGSGRGRKRTAGKSRSRQDGASERMIHRLHAVGRPDLMLAVAQAKVDREQMEAAAG